MRSLPLPPCRRPRPLPRSSRAAVRAVAAAACGAVLLLCGCSGDDSTFFPVSQSTYLGLSANPAEGAPPESLLGALLTARATGVNLAYLGYLWRELEPAPGEVDVAALRATLAGLQSLGFAVYVNLRIVDTNVNQLPPDLAGKPFDDPAVIARLDALVDSLLAVARERPLAALALGNEVDVYFGLHPVELPAFRALYQREAGRIHAALSSLPVGVCTTSPVSNPNASIGDLLNGSSDVAVYTYYPFASGSDFRHRAPSTLEGDMSAMRLRAAPRPFALQEIGYSSSPANGSSDSLQADFVRRFRAHVRGRPRGELYFANWFLYSDLPAAVVDTLVGYYGLDTPGFRAYLGHLGLRRADGAPKPAWEAWRE
jgi:hypothetical protein